MSLLLRVGDTEFADASPRKCCFSYNSETTQPSRRPSSSSHRYSCAGPLAKRSQATSSLHSRSICITLHDEHCSRTSCQFRISRIHTPKHSTYFRTTPNLPVPGSISVVHAPVTLPKCARAEARFDSSLGSRPESRLFFGIRRRSPGEIAFRTEHGRCLEFRNEITVVCLTQLLCLTVRR